MIGEAGWRAAVGAVRALAGDVDVIAGVDRLGAERVGLCRDLARRDRFYLSLRLRAGRGQRHQADAREKAEMRVSCGLGFFLRFAEKFAQALADDHFFAVLNGHRHEFNVIDLWARRFARRLLNTFMHGGNEARIVRAENFDARDRFCEERRRSRRSSSPSLPDPNTRADVG